MLRSNPLPRYYHDGGGTKNMEAMLAVIDRPFLTSRNGGKDIVGTVRALCMASSNRTFSKRQKLFYTCREVINNIGKRQTPYLGGEELNAGELKPSMLATPLTTGKPHTLKAKQQQGASTNYQSVN